MENTPAARPSSVAFALFTASSSVLNLYNFYRLIKMLNTQNVKFKGHGRGYIPKCKYFIFKHSRFGPPNYQNVSKMAQGPKCKQKWSQNVSNQNVSILTPKYQNISIWMYQNVSKVQKCK